MVEQNTTNYCTPILLVLCFKGRKGIVDFGGGKVTTDFMAIWKWNIFLKEWLLITNTQAPEVSIWKKITNSFSNNLQNYRIQIKSAHFKSITLYLNNEMMVRNILNKCSPKKALEEVLRSSKFLRREYHVYSLLNNWMNKGD